MQRLCMDIKTFISTHDESFVEQVCKKANTDFDYLRFQVCGGHRKVSTKLAKKLVEASGGLLTLHELRPDVWQKAAA
jgi:hypothetical protein